MRLEPPPRKTREADLTGLINIIFLILIFFLIAGTLRTSNTRDLKLVRIEAPGQSAGAERGQLIIHDDGHLTYRGRALHLADLSAVLAADMQLDRGRPFVVIGDARANASHAVHVIAAIQAAGISEVSLLAERGGRRLPPDGNQMNMPMRPPR